MVCMEYCVLKRADRSVKARDFTKLWPGQYARVLAHEDIFLSMFAQGGGSACKFQYEERTEWKGRPMLVYAHCQERFPRIGVLIHESRPKLVVNQEIVTRDDGLARAVSWHYSASGTRITTKFFYSNEKITQRRALHHLLDHLVQFNVCTPVTDVTLSADFQPNALIFKPDTTHDAKILEEERSVRPCSDIQMMSDGDSDEGGSDLQIVKAFRV
ncbi:unnamed protein product [Effrenium voratum]|uniref:Uncharacterized protein n=1 Tax=Effrenium voratum TaxID=2562239 RepID=A0AA36N691_9DINO|nr:unnamed protein product [Effrenium voratum]CAJ1392065.1 unnamed protein product [Effrenium voratum]CAJ1405562.1 unnamed protein product [Effrenium voratum]CAJ1413331.1 unnamed protein product [Effrenium voratum]CAJ1451560.1 unnamed protein product [Effrenium voratum]